MARYLLAVIVLGVLMIRFLMVAGGTATFEPTVPSPGGDGEVFTLASPAGGWTTPQYPKATYYNGKTYVGWVSGTNGGVYVASYDHATQTTSTPYLLHTFAVDDHNNPAVMVRNDGRIVVAYSGHSTAAMYIRISSNPEDVTAFGAETNIDGQLGGGRYTYPALMQLNGVANDPIFLFYRDLASIISETGRIGYSVSTDGGTTWAAHTLLFTGANDKIPYWSIVSDFDSRIDVMTTSGNPYGAGMTIGHMYYDGSAWKKSDGSALGGSAPHVIADLTQVYDGADGPAFVMDGLSGANPRFGIIVSTGAGATISARHTRWNGSAWSTSEVFADAAHPVDRYYGSLVFNRADPDEMFAGITQSSTVTEIFAFTTADTGATWSEPVAVTTGSDNMNTSVIGVVNGVAAVPALWLTGFIEPDLDFSWIVRGLRR